MAPPEIVLETTAEQLKAWKWKKTRSFHFYASRQSLHLSQVGATPLYQIFINYLKVNVGKIKWTSLQKIRHSWSAEMCWTGTNPSSQHQVCVLASLSSLFPPTSLLCVTLNLLVFQYLSPEDRLMGNNTALLEKYQTFFFVKTWWISVKRTCMRWPRTFIYINTKKYHVFAPMGRSNFIYMREFFPACQ